MERTKSTHRFPVKWYVHVLHPRAGRVRGRTFYLSTTGLVFYAPIRCRPGDVVDLEIFYRATESIHCKARVEAEGSPYHAEFIEFIGTGFKTLNDALLSLHRAAINKR